MDHIIKSGSMDWEFAFRDRRELNSNTKWPVRNIDEVLLKGDISALLDIETLRFAIIGDDNISLQTIEQIEKIITNIARYSNDNQMPVIITFLGGEFAEKVSEMAIHYGFPTIAVTDCDMETALKQKNQNLIKKLLHAPGSGLLSQFAPKDTNGPLVSMDALKTVVLMSDALVIASATRTGTEVLAAEYAKSCRIPVFAIPGSPENHMTTGCNRLIRDGLAEMIIEYDEIGSHFGF